ncbi:hypothetical protein [Nonomuraea terrae]|uniref:hypothetical protein n=1 Tax=Nonomuraea terrae TaxID=2530383 RepID=UPI0014044AFC|nr:hypothetical protein [Nonomuraea terrae]
MALGLMSFLARGTFKGIQMPQSIIATGGPCAAFIPMGVTMLRDGPRPSRRALLWLVAVIGLLLLGNPYGPWG